MKWWSFSRLAVVAGNGRDVGSGGGVSRRGQSQSDVRLTLLSLSAWFSWIDESVSVDRSISPTDGNVVDIMPNSIQASLLRKNLSVLSVTYVTCRVSTLFPSLSLPEILRTTAPRILIPLLLAACIFSVTGISVSVLIPRGEIVFRPARQLWQPVSAMHWTMADLGLMLTLNPRSL